MTSQATAQQSTAPDDTAGAWGRLNARLILVNLSVLAGPLGAFFGTYVLSGTRINLQALITLGVMLLVLLIITGISLMRYFTTRYRVTADRVELRSGLLFRSLRSIPIDRIRSVDQTANPVHRIFGLTSVRIGTGEQTASAGRRLSLDGISKRQAEELRQQLLERRVVAGGYTATDDDGPIAELDWSWLRYGPLTIWGVGGVFLAAGTVYRTLHEMKIDPLQLGAVKSIENRFGSVPLWFGLLASLVIVVVLGVLGSSASFIEAWAGYRLEREDGGTFHVRRGLLVTRSVSIEERRLQGVEVGETMFLRWAGGARLNAVASGLGNDEENRKRRMLTPPVPRAEALRVAAEVLSEEQAAMVLTADLMPHPRVALRRRINRGLTVVALVAATLAGLGLWLGAVWLNAAWITALVLIPFMVALAQDAYRTLGHGIRGRYLITRAGTFSHRTVALRREGIIGWSVSRSVFQRRAGLITLAATTSAGDGRYKVRDVSVSEGLAFAEEVVPGLLAPFIERVETGGRGGGHRRA